MSIKKILFRLNHWETWHYLAKYIPLAPDVKFELKSIELPKYKYFNSMEYRKTKSDAE